MELDNVDHLAAKYLDGFLVRKDLVRIFSKQFHMPTYVVEFMLGRYCSSINEDDIADGLDIVQKQLKSRTVKAGEEELFKSKAKEKGTVKIIDVISAKFDTKNDAYVAYLPSLQLNDVRISGQDVRENERMLTGGFYAEITLAYDAAVAQGSNVGPFSVRSLSCSRSARTVPWRTTITSTYASPMQASRVRAAGGLGALLAVQPDRPGRRSPHPTPMALLARREARARRRAVGRAATARPAAAARRASRVPKVVRAADDAA